LHQVCQITRERWENGVHTIEMGYRISSLEPERADAQELLALDRGHWGIENGLHHVRDVALSEDLCRVRSQNAPQVMAAARNLALGILRTLRLPSIAAVTRKIVMHPLEGLRRLMERT
jgi:predicted transposase YbfD/YdcC